MTKIERILVATDFSAAGNRAVQVAGDWAHRHRAALRILHVAPPKRWMSSLWKASSATIRAIHQHAESALQRAAETVDPTRQLEVSTGLVTGSASKEIQRAARELNADLLVIGSSGEREAMLGTDTLGGTASKLVESTPVSLLLVRKTVADSLGPVLAAVDLSPVSSTVLDWARITAAGGQLHVFHAYDVPFASRLESYGLAPGAIEVYTQDERAGRDEQVAALLASAGGDASIQRIVQRGDAALRLFEHIRRLEPALIVVGKHARSANRSGSKSYGSVCRYTVLFSAANVLVVAGHT